jgi:hypothetical protein
VPKLAGPFTTGNYSETVQDTVRIYDNSGFPLIEVFANQDTADTICKILNENYDRYPDA